MRNLLAIAIVLMLGGCGMMMNEYAPERTAEKPLLAGSGRIILSTGAPAKCVDQATYLKLLPEGASASDKQIALVSIDSYALKSDFADHHGNLHVIPVPAGRYYFTPRTDNLVIRSKDPRFDTSNVTKRLMVLEGGVPPCDFSNRELTCR